MCLFTIDTPISRHYFNSKGAQNASRLYDLAHIKGIIMSEVTPSKAATTPANKPAALEPKYRGPNGETWSGRGKTPQWLTDLANKK